MKQTFSGMTVALVILALGSPIFAHAEEPAVKRYTLGQATSGCAKAYGVTVLVAVGGILLTPMMLMADIADKLSPADESSGKQVVRPKQPPGYTSEMWDEVEDVTSRLTEKDCNERWDHLAKVNGRGVPSDHHDEVAVTGTTEKVPATSRVAI
jgi:hypothetical protein